MTVGNNLGEIDYGDDGLEEAGEEKVGRLRGVGQDVEGGDGERGLRGGNGRPDGGGWKFLGRIAAVVLEDEEERRRSRRGSKAEG